MRVVSELKPRAIVMSGFGRHFKDRKVKCFFGMDEVLHKANVPMLCICGSHQLAGFSFSSNLKKVKALKDQPMRKIGSGEDLPRKAQGGPKYDLSGFFVAEGFFPIKRVKKDPIFAGLPQNMIMRCSHYCEVKRLPAEFILLARSEHCGIEAMRHRERPVYGTQFHAENWEEPYLHGRQIISNFFAMAGLT